VPAKNDDLHGNVPDRAEVALLLIDVINDLEFPGSEPLIEQMLQPDQEDYFVLKPKHSGFFSTTLGKKLEWDAETTTLEPSKRIAWNSRDGGDIKTSGQVTFNALSQGETEITILLQYVPPAGRLGEFIANLFSDPKSAWMKTCETSNVGGQAN
jgi:hypothetical protein